MKKVKKCSRCKKAKRMTRHQRICSQCKQDGFFGGSYFRWLWDMAKRSDKQAMPSCTDELIKVFEVRKFAIKARGYYRENQSIGTKYNYHIGHRYPASKGGKLIAENLVVMPALVNLTLRDKHGDGLESYRVERTEGHWTLDEFKDYVASFDIERLQAYIGGSEATNINDFETNGLAMGEVLQIEAERLGEEPKGTDLLVSSYYQKLSKFSQLANGLEQLETLMGFDDIHQQLLNYRKQQDGIMGFDIEPSNEFDVDDTLIEMESAKAMERLKELKAQGELGGNEANHLADMLTPLELEQNQMYFEVQENQRVGLVA
ncbi:hypothetical protein [Vibrio sp. 1CM23M]|uniref:hypothetical protein n=1 Tax=Vibrio sp. 1CM23M TaxID=2929164 RepID=UPI0020BD9980|nr:hypothetical protein [Vibrio sp. 1CM23M]MCK8071587.1 hypothetical protein [Vibrio sp. 1CM23M]